VSAKLSYDTLISNL